MQSKRTISPSGSPASEPFYLKGGSVAAGKASTRRPHSRERRGVESAQRPPLCGSLGHDDEAIHIFTSVCVPHEVSRRFHLRSTCRALLSEPRSVSREQDQVKRHARYRLHHFDR